MDRRTQHALQMILNACAVQQYVTPYHVTVTDHNGTRIAGQIDEEGGTTLAGDFASAGVFSSPLKVSLSDARGESADFSVTLLDDENGQTIAPIITYPAKWIKPKPSDPTIGSVQ